MDIRFILCYNQQKFTTHIRGSDEENIRTDYGNSQQCI